MALDLPPAAKLWVPPKPAIIRPAPDIIAPVLGITMLARTSLVRAKRPAAAAATPPSYVNAGALAGSAGTTSLAVSFPGSVAADDIALLWSISYSAMTYPGTFTAETGVQDVPTATLFRMGWKRCSGTEGGTSVNITLSSNQIWAQIAIFTGCVASGTPYEGYSAVTGSDSTGTLTTPAIVSTVDQTLGVLLAINNGNVTFTPASGFTERLDNANTTGVDAAFAVDTIVKAAAGTTSAGTKASSPATVAGYAIFGLALKPA